MKQKTKVRIGVGMALIPFVAMFALCIYAAPLLVGLIIVAGGYFALMTYWMQLDRAVVPKGTAEE